ncbi:MAG TPA: choice-of-anchor tandem repeat GloVer-containing protein [Chthonomonadaceae bacterium]|nr:choice-of-anchor tandem repeat GloVer-containing protein [Chthonomonadaceae bacterium]
MFDSRAFSHRPKAVRLDRALTFLLIFCLALGLASVRPAQAQLTDSVLYSFNSASGAANSSYTTGRLALGKDGNYYGTTVGGGLYGYGTLFEVSPSGQLTVLHNFTNGNDGANPTNGVVFDGKGNLYGDAANGAIGGFGVTYEYSPATDTFTVLYQFHGPDGDGPNGVMLIGNNLYGVTYFGGIGSGLGNGVVYKIELPTATRSLTFKVLHYFSGSDGENMWGPLVEGSDKYLYGTTGFGANGEEPSFKSARMAASSTRCTRSAGRTAPTRLPA